MAGARKVSDVPPERLDALHSGAQSQNLTEGLAIDFAKLAALLGLSSGGIAELEAARGEGITKRMALAARLSLETGISPEHLARHSSDTVRGWAAFAMAEQGGALETQLARVRPLADDPHFGVREWAWLAVRPALATEIEAAISLLTPWTAERSPNLRRFATEATRPRGVWCAHIKRLKEEPEIALPLLIPLKADPARYVQDSVGNWLNDAAKSRPDWVRGLCSEWASENPATQYICRRAQRSLK